MSGAQIQKGSDIDGETLYDESGSSVSMPNTYTLAIGAPFNSNSNGSSSGHVRVYSWDDNGWSQKGPDIDGENATDFFGTSVSMPDENTVAAGAPYYNNYSGSVRVFRWSGNNWIQKGNTIVGEASNDRAGYAISMPDSNTIAVGAYYNDGNGNESGQVRVYSWNGTDWIQKGSDLDGEEAGDQFGWSVSMPDANTLVAGSPGSSGNGNYESGQVRIFSWNGTSWVQKGTAINGDAAVNSSGYSVGMPDANTVAIGAPFNSGNGSNSGQTRVFQWDGANWIQKGNSIYGEAAYDYSAKAISMPDAITLAIGAVNNIGNSTDAGRVRIYQWNGNTWTKKGNNINGEASGDFSGTCVSMPNADMVAIGAPYNDGNGDRSGHVRVFHFAPLGIPGTNLANTTVYPNPVTDKMTIDLGQPFNDVQLCITDLTGKEMYSQDLGSLQTHTVDLQIAPGIYLLHLYSMGQFIGLLKIIRS